MQDLKLKESCQEEELIPFVAEAISHCEERLKGQDSGEDDTNSSFVPISE